MNAVQNGGLLKPGFLCSAFLLLLIFIEGISSVLLSWIEGRAIDIIAYGEKNVVLIEMALLLFAIIIFFQWISSVFAPYFFKRIYLKKLTVMRNKVIESILSAAVLRSGKMSEGDLSSRLTVDMKVIESFFLNNFYIFLRRICIAIFAVILAILINWKLAVLEFFILPLVVFLNIKINSSMDENYYLIDEYQGNMTHLLLEAIKGIKIIKAFCAENFFYGKFKIVLANICEENVKNNKLITGSSCCLILVNLIPTVIHFIAGASLIYLNQITYGDFVIFGILRGHISSFLMFLPAFIPQSHKVQASIKRIFEIITLSKDEYKIFNSNKEKKYGVCAKNISFSFNNNVVFSALNVKLSFGELTVLSGESGSGKTTLLHVLSGLYPAETGTISYSDSLLTDGILDIAFVGQQPYIFSASVIDNIRIGNSDASFEQIVEICKMLNIYDAIMRLPNQFNTRIGESSEFSLSGGELQRLCIARACVSNAKLVVMDEPTSSLDTQNETAVSNILNHIKKDRVVFLITHSLTVEQAADRILSLHDGKLSEVIANIDFT